MKRAMSDVRAFHEKYGFPMDLHLREREERATQSLRNLGEIVRQVGAHINRLAAVEQKDVRLERAHYMTEELGEAYDALARSDPVALLDALADLVYVAVGTAVIFGLPLPEAFDEVHASNMTKDVDRSRFGHPKKGEQYRLPQLESLMRYLVERRTCRAYDGSCNVAPCPLTCPGRPDNADLAKIGGA